MAAEGLKGPFRHIWVRAKLIGAVLLALVVFSLLPAYLDVPTRALIGWNVAVVVFLVMVGYIMAHATDRSMRKRAEELDEGRYTVLVLAMVASTASLAAIVFELYNLRNHPGQHATLYIGLSAATILTSWSFIHVMFTEHYAHEFYMARGPVLEGGEDLLGNGLKFPRSKHPDYLDFMYFAFTIGVANQTSDIVIESRTMRILVLIHSIISYFFNTIILALTINIAAGLLES